MKTMKKAKPIETIDIQQLKHLRYDYLDGEHIVTLVDSTRHEILKGYGKNIVDAINDLHYNLL